MSAAVESPTGRRRSSARNLIPDGASPASLMALKALNVTLNESDPLPEDMTAETVTVQVKVSLEQDREVAEVVALANQVQEMATENLSKVYKGSPDGPYLLKVYVVLVCEKSMSNNLTFGFAGEPQTECLEWFLEAQGKILKSGRVGVEHSGPFQQRQVNEVTEELCGKIVDIIALKGKENE